MHFIAYILVYPLIWLISILPFKLLYLFSDFLYIILYKVFGYRKKTVKDNLNLVFPEKSDKEVAEIMRKFYHHLCDMIVESIKSLTISEKELLKHFKFENIELIKDFEKKQQSIILMCGHFGSWEWIFILQTFVSAKGHAIYKKLTNKYFDNLVKRIRAKHNTHLITTKETFKVLQQSKTNGELTINGFVADQSPKAEKAIHWNSFMGINVPMYVGAEVLAKQLDMAVVFFGVERISRGHYMTTFKTIAENPNDFPNYDITDQYFKLVEEQIYNAPEYYLWTHKRWKHKDKAPKSEK